MDAISQYNGVHNISYKERAWYDSFGNITEITSNGEIDKGYLWFEDVYWRIRIYEIILEKKRVLKYIRMTPGSVLDMVSFFLFIALLPFLS